MTDTYRLNLRVPLASQPIFENALECFDGALVSGLSDAEGFVELDLYLAEAPPREEVVAQVTVAALAGNIEVPDFLIEPVPDIDWVAESQKGLPPIHAGRFWLYGSHVKDPAPGGSLPLLVEANAAFGTGQHESTFGCLVAMSLLSKAWQPRRILDMGSGSGVLSMAAAKLWHRHVLAVEMDRPSVAVARENARVNGVASLVTTVEGLGYRPGIVSASSPYDLILANILAEPLMKMAPELARNLASGGYAILAGLLTRQARAVIARHRQAGLHLYRALEFGEWSTLILHRAHSSDPGSAF